MPKPKKVSRIINGSIQHKKLTTKQIKEIKESKATKDFFQSLQYHRNAPFIKKSKI